MFVFSHFTLWSNFGLGFIFYVFDNLMHLNLNMDTCRESSQAVQGKNSKIDDTIIGASKSILLFILFISYSYSKFGDD